MKVVRNWIRTASNRQMIPDGGIIWQRYQDFMVDLPQMAQIRQLDANNLIFNDYTWMIVEWLQTKKNPLSKQGKGGD